MEEGQRHHKPLRSAFLVVGMAYTLSAENKLAVFEGQKWH